jgi:RHS repeat-associated protein
VNTSGTLTGTTSYDAWGNPETTGGLAATTPFGYAGGYTDPDGLVYLINRYYDPATGQFTDVDPEVDQTWQPYGYTGGDPVNRIDPNGLYYYNYNWTLGNRGSAGYVFSYLAHHASRVFPFSTGGCTTLYLGEHCDFVPAPGQNDHLHVSRMSSTSLTLYVDNWCQFSFIWCWAEDPPGSTITFTVNRYSVLWVTEDVLQQVGIAPWAPIITNMIAPGAAWYQWLRQAINLSSDLGGGWWDVHYLG